jgi:cytochrome b involved in lipid metabolism
MLVGLTILFLLLPLAVYHTNPSWIMSLRWLLLWPSASKEPDGYNQGAGADSADSADNEPPTTGSSESTPRASPVLRHDPPPLISLDDDDDDDADLSNEHLPPPQFPAANSAQRASSSLAPPPHRTVTPHTTPAPSRPSSSLMPPPPRPPPRPPTAAGRAPAPRPAAAQPRPGASLGNTLALAPTAPPRRGPGPSRKVVLAPGHSPLDWALLQQRSATDLSGVASPTARITPSRLRAHNGRRGMPAWAAYRGRVYNLTPYLPFHPGGEGELRRAAGRDGERLFVEVHPWVNWEQMLGRCLVGVLVAEGDGEAGEGGGGLEDLD